MWIVINLGQRLLKETKGINFIGNVEAREIPEGVADVVVCDAFVGNVILKLYEGVGGVLLSKIKGTITNGIKNKLGALLIKKDLKILRKLKCNIYVIMGIQIIG